MTTLEEKIEVMKKLYVNYDDTWNEEIINKRYKTWLRNQNKKYNDIEQNIEYEDQPEIETYEEILQREHEEDQQYIFTSSEITQEEIDKPIELIEKSDDSIIPNIKDMKEIIFPNGHFIQKYIEHMKKGSDAYPEYHLASAFSILSSCCNTDTYLETSIGNIKPNIWAILIGQSSKSRKTNAMKKGIEFIRQNELKKIAPTSGSIEAVLEFLNENNNEAVFYNDEMGSLFHAMNTPKDATRDIMCKLYDGTDIYRQKVAKKNQKTSWDIEKPYTSAIFAVETTNLIHAATSVDVTSGFMFRFLIAAPTYEKAWGRISKVTKKSTNDNVELDHFIQSISNYISVGRKIDIDDDALDYLNDIGENMDRDAMQTNDTILESAVGRYVPYILKLAILLELGKAKHNSIISKETIILATQIGQIFLRDSVKVCKLIANEKNDKEYSLILEKMNDWTTKRNLYKRCNLRSTIITPILEGMIKDRIIETKEEKASNNRIVIYYKKIE